MKCILGERLNIKEKLDGIYSIAIDRAEIYMMPYEMAKFMYLLRKYANGDIDKSVNNTIGIQTEYRVNGNSYKISIFVDDINNLINIGICYNLICDKAKEDKDLEDIKTIISINITADTARALISRYVELEYNRLNDDDEE